MTTPDLIEKMARRLHEHDNPEALGWVLFSDEWKQAYHGKAAAALSVALEAIGEECARISDAHATNAWEIANGRGENPACASGRNHAGRAIAVAIRARIAEMKRDLPLAD